MSLTQTFPFFIGVATVALLVMPAYAATQTEIDQARAKGTAWLIANQSGDGSWKTPGGLQAQSTAAALEALLNAGITKGRTFATAQSWLTNADCVSIDSLSRQSIALYKTGSSVTSIMTRLTGMRHVRPTGSDVQPDAQAPG